MSDDYKITDPEEQRLVGDPDGARHPGPFIRTEVLAPLKLKVAPAAAAMGFHRGTFINVLDGKAPVTRDLAYRLEALTGLSADLLIGMQALYDRKNELPVREEYKRTIARWVAPADRKVVA